MPAKRSLWAKEPLNLYYLMNVIYYQVSRTIFLARAHGRPVEKRCSANLSFGLEIEQICAVCKNDAVLISFLYLKL